MAIIATRLQLWTISRAVFIFLMLTGQLTKAINENDAATPFPTITLDIGYIFPEKMEIIIRNSHGNNITLKYSRVKEIDDELSEIKEKELSKIVEVNNAEERVYLTGLKPNSDYEICAVINETYACEMAKTFKHIDNKKALTIGAVAACVGYGIIMTVALLLYMIKRYKKKQYQIENKDKENDQDQNIATIS